MEPGRSPLTGHKGQIDSRDAALGAQVPDSLEPQVLWIPKVFPLKINILDCIFNTQFSYLHIYTTENYHPVFVTLPSSTLKCMSGKHSVMFHPITVFLERN